MSRTITVIGATGHLGRLAVEALLERGVAPSDIRATGRATERLADLADGHPVRHRFADGGRQFPAGGGCALEVRAGA